MLKCIQFQLMNEWLMNLLIGLNKLDGFLSFKYQTGTGYGLLYRRHSDD